MHRHLIAILRGITTDEAAAVCDALLSAGISQIEIPLNSPDPMCTIEMMVKQYGADARIGAGTVLTCADVDMLAEIGAHMVISPNMNPEVIARTKQLGMMSCPGILTPTEGFAALAAGADMLKLFPADIVGPSGVKALRAVLPADVKLAAVGGVGPDKLSVWAEAGITAFAIGSSLYKPCMSSADVGAVARQLVAEYDGLTR